MGYDWKFALSAVFVEGIIFLILTACNIREAIINSIPSNLKKAISVGIGFFIAFIGLVNAGIVKGNASTLVELNPQWLSTPGPIVAVIGLVIMIVLMVKRVKGAMLIGILATTVIGIPLGVTNYAGGSFAPHAPYFFPFEFAHMASFDFITVCFTFLFVDMFDTVGTLIGCSTKAGLLKEDGSIPHVKEALFADAVGTTVGAILGCSTVTTFVESSAGVVEGGKTGLTAVTAAILFLLAMFLSPIFESIPSAATAPALILVGVLMVSPIKDLEFDDLTELVPAYLCILFMVVTYSISNGILIGILGYTVLKLFTGKGKDITVMTWVVAILFILEIIFSPLV
jgi:AGZA family xanthine/uracil permease-like MFS transporter